MRARARGGAVTVWIGSKVDGDMPPEQAEQWIAVLGPAAAEARRQRGEEVPDLQSATEQARADEPIDELAAVPDSDPELEREASPWWR